MSKVFAITSKPLTAQVLHVYWWHQAENIVDITITAKKKLAFIMSLSSWFVCKQIEKFAVEFFPSINSAIESLFEIRIEMHV